MLNANMNSLYNLTKTFYCKNSLNAYQARYVYYFIIPVINTAMVYKFHFNFRAMLCDILCL